MGEKVQQGESSPGMLRQGGSSTESRNQPPPEGLTECPGDTCSPDLHPAKPSQAGSQQAPRVGTRRAALHLLPNLCLKDSTWRVQSLPTPPHPAAQGLCPPSQHHHQGVPLSPDSPEGLEPLWRQGWHRGDSLLNCGHRNGSCQSPAAHRSQHTPWMCSSACGITAGTGKVGAAGLQCD